MHVRMMAAWVALALCGAALPSIAVAATKAATKAVAKAPAKAPAKAAKKPATKTAAKKPSKKASPAKSEILAEEADDRPSEEVRQLTAWIVASGDNNDLPFMVIDKTAAEVRVHNEEGELVGKSPALLGVTFGDDSVPGVGDRELSEISPEERTTPAGRFIAKFGLSSDNRKVLWVDYATSISLHPVVTTKKKERRLERLKSPTPEDNRITFGCINVPPAFYTKVVRPRFAKGIGVVYILPESRPLNATFLAFQPQRLPPLPELKLEDPAQAIAQADGAR